MSYYKLKKIVANHAPAENISADFDGGITWLDLLHGLEQSSRKTKGLLIKNEVEYIIDEIVNKIIL